MIIYALRHGQTDYNQKRLVQGLMDNPLNEMGILQASTVGKYFSKHDFKFDYVYATPLSRAIDTAKTILHEMKTNQVVNIAPLMIERDFGPFEGKGVDETIAAISKAGFVHQGYEDNDKFLSRIQNGLNDLYSNHTHDKILLVAHSHTIKALLILADPQKYHFLTFLNNASYCVFDYDGKSLNVTDFNTEIPLK